MRPNTHPSNRTAVLVTCSVCLVTAVASFCLAFTVPSPSQTLRPLISNLDSMHSPVFVGMFGAGLLILASTVAMVSALYGNRALDLAACAAHLTVCILALVSLELVAIFKTTAEAQIEAPMLASIALYGPGNSSAYKAWDEMQEDMTCCAVHTNAASAAYGQTPWYKLMLLLEPHVTPQIPNSCCSRQEVTRDPAKLSACATLPAVPKQNPYMNPIGCFEAAVLMTDTFAGRYLLIGVILFIAACVALGTGLSHLIRRSHFPCLILDDSKEPKRLIKCKLPGCALRGCDNLGATVMSTSNSRESVAKEVAIADHAVLPNQARKSPVPSSTLTTSASGSRQPSLTLPQGRQSNSNSPGSAPVQQAPAMKYQYQYQYQHQYQQRQQQQQQPRHTHASTQRRQMPESRGSGLVSQI